MKKILVSIFLLVFGLCLVGCVDTPNGPGSEQPRGDYDNSKLYSMYPLYVSQDEYGSKFEIKHTFKLGIFSTIEDLEDIKCENLPSLFNCDFSEEYLKENFVALYFKRVERMWNESLCNVNYYDLFIENGQIYVTISYDDYQETGDAVVSGFHELILIPKEWKNEINKTSNYEINYNVEYNNSNIKNKYIMRYSKMQEFKDAYRKQKLNNKYDDQLYREIYMLDVYGEYNNCLVSTVTYDGYVHTDVDLTVTDTFGDVTITYSLHYPIYACYNSTLYSLTEAYNNSYLTIDDISEIAKRVGFQKTSYQKFMTNFFINIDALTFSISGEHNELIIKEDTTIEYIYSYLYNLQVTKIDSIPPVIDDARLKPQFKIFTNNYEIEFYNTSTRDFIIINDGQYFEVLDANIESLLNIIC